MHLRNEHIKMSEANKGLRIWVFNHQILNCKVEEVAAISNQDTFLFKHIYNNVRCQTSGFLFIHIHQLAALKSFPCSLVAISTMGLGGLYLRSDFLVTFADQVSLKDKWNLIKKKYNLTWIKVFCINFEMKPGWIANCRSDLNWFEVSILLKFGCCQNLVSKRRSPGNFVVVNHSYNVSPRNSPFCTKYHFNNCTRHLHLPQQIHYTLLCLTSTQGYVRRQHSYQNHDQFPQSVRLTATIIETCNFTLVSH